MANMEIQCPSCLHTWIGDTFSPTHCPQCAYVIVFDFPSVRAKQTKPYCCECDYCHLNGLECDSSANHVSLSDGMYFLFCDNHASNMVADVIQHRIKHPLAEVVIHG